MFHPFLYYMTMQTIVGTENFVWNMLQNVRRVLSVDEYTCVLYLLYGIHKQYKAIRVGHNELWFDNEEDEILQHLYVESIRRDGSLALSWELYQQLTSIPYDSYEQQYKQTIESLLLFVSKNAGKSAGEFLTPTAITKVMSHILKSQGCNSVYDPFCGTSAVAHNLSSLEKFVGQDLSSKAILISKVIADAYGLNYTEFRCADSICDWDGRHFDAVVACPPFAYRITQDRTIFGAECKDWNFRTLEELFFWRAFNRNQAKVAVLLDSVGFCFRHGGEYSIRKYLVDNNLLDMIVALPTNILFETSIPSVIVVCKTNRKEDEPIKFIHAEEYYCGSNVRDRELNSSKVIDAIEQFSGETCVNVPIDSIVENDYNISPVYYSNESITLHDGQKVVRLGDLFIEDDRRMELDTCDIVSPQDLSVEFIQSLLQRNIATGKNSSRIPSSRFAYSCEDGSSYLAVMSFGINSLRLGLYDKGVFRCSNGVKFYRINSQEVIPEYLIWMLLNNDSISKGGMPFDNHLTRKVVIDNLEKQRIIVDSLLREYSLRVNAEKEANEQRLGIKRNISDLEHMLGTPQFKIGRIISRLESMQPGDKYYQSDLKALKDNFDYMSRIISFTNAMIDKSSFNLSEGNLNEFLTAYTEGWQNYGRNVFTLKVVNNIADEYAISFDKTLLTVMFDSILNNAAIHGFHKDKRHTDNNTVQIELSMVEYNQKAFACIKVCNNGDPFDESFHLDDYISKGRFTASTGRSGLGGYHVYQVAKGHNGYLYLDTNKMWNTVVEVLLPIETSSSNIIQYEHECI